MPKYFNGRWHYPETWSPDDILEHALRFALADYERLSSLSMHALTQGPAALLDALEQWGEVSTCT